MTLEVQLRVGGLRAAAEAAFADGLNFSDTVLGVVYGLAFTNVNGEFPLLFIKTKMIGGESRTQSTSYMKISTIGRILDAKKARKASRGLVSVVFSTCHREVETPGGTGPPCRVK